MYMTSHIPYNSLAKAQHAFEQTKGYRVIDLYSDSSAALVFVQDKPVQPAQAKFVGTNIQKISNH